LGPVGQLNRSGCGSWGLWLILLAALGFALFNIFGSPGSNATQISYTAFHQQLENGNVASVTINNQQVTGQLKKQATTENSQGQNVQYKDFVTYIPSFGDDQLLTLMQQQGVRIQVQPQSSGVSWVAILGTFLPLLLLLGVGYLFYRQMRSQGQSIMSGFGMRKSGATLYERSKERTTFDDIAGLQGAKTELEEIIEFLKNPSYFQRLGGEVPRGVLLVGPPGTGKTLLARAVAGEANVPFFSITGSNFMEMLVGVGASRVRDLFEEAKKASPSIIFIDELDSIGRRRGAGLGGGHDEREQTLNQLLSEMDGFEPNEGVIVMAATNRPDILDPALLRPGRFDRRIAADLPTMWDRQEILRIHSRNKPLADDIDLEEIARGTPGFSGADLENLLNEAALLAARQGKDRIGRDDIEEARDKVIMGLERENLALSDEEMRLLAYHEGGHAVVAAVLPNADPIHKVTIVPRGRAMGVTQQLPERDKYVYRREYMLDRLAVMMGGRAAENLVLGTSTSGAENDLKQATMLARKMVLDWGMSERLGHIAFGTRGDQVFLGQEIAQRRDYSETTAREVDEEVQSLLDESYNLAATTLKERREQLDQIADALLEHEELPGTKVLELLGIDKEKATISFDGDGNKGQRPASTQSKSTGEVHHVVRVEYYPSRGG
jgi:cell division protease FtsH